MAQQHGRAIYRNQRICDVLRERSQTQRWFCQQIGVDESYLSQIKAQRRGIPRWVVKRSVEVLGVPESELFFDRIPVEERSHIRAKPQPKQSKRDRRTNTSRDFWSMVAPANENGCREWTGFSGPNGYGWGGFKRLTGEQQSYAHRIAYVLAYGPIPEGKNILHRCGNRLCCNPRHLYAGTPAENMRDRDLHGRTARGSRSAQAKITESQALEIIHLRGSVTAREAAARCNATMSIVYSIWHGRAWKHLHAEKAAQHVA